MSQSMVSAAKQLTIGQLDSLDRLRFHRNLLKLPEQAGRLKQFTMTGTRDDQGVVLSIVNSPLFTVR